MSKHTAVSQKSAPAQHGSTPAYSGRMHYIEGYDPVSYEAPHSSLLRTSTWVGMGLVLAALCPAGTMVYAGSLMAFGNTGHAVINPSLILIIGAVLLVAFPGGWCGPDLPRAALLLPVPQGNGARELAALRWGGGSEPAASEALLLEAMMRKIMWVAIAGIALITGISFLMTGIEML